MLIAHTDIFTAKFICRVIVQHKFPLFSYMQA